jgi:ABC-type amino acid transport system permease subunit
VVAGGVDHCGARGRASNYDAYPSSMAISAVPSTVLRCVVGLKATVNLTVFSYVVGIVLGLHCN